MLDKIKTLKIKEKTHRKLLKYGDKGETFDGVINRLLEEVSHYDV